MLQNVTPSKALKPEQSEELRAFLREKIETEFDGKVLRAAKAIGITQQSLRDFMMGARGAGAKLLLAVSTHWSVPVGELIGLKPKRTNRQIATELLAADLNISVDRAEAVAQQRAHAFSGGDKWSVVRWIHEIENELRNPQNRESLEVLTPDDV